MMSCTKKFLKVIAGFVAGIVLVVGFCGPGAGVASAGKFDRRAHPLSATTGPDGRPLAVGTMRAMSTEHDDTVMNAIFSNGVPMDVVYAEGRLICLMRNGLTSNLAVFDITTPGTEPKVFEFGVSVKKMVLDEANRRVWLIHDSIASFRRRHHDSTPRTMSYLTLDDVLRSADSAVLNLVPINEACLPAGQVPLDIAVSNTGGVAVLTRTALVMFQGNVQASTAKERHMRIVDFTIVPQGVPLLAVFAADEGSVTYDSSGSLWVRRARASDTDFRCRIVRPDFVLSPSFSMPKRMKILGLGDGWKYEPEQDAQEQVASAAAVNSESANAPMPSLVFVNSTDHTAGIIRIANGGEDLKDRTDIEHVSYNAVDGEDSNGTDGFPYSAAVGPDGCLWYVDLVNSAITRLGAGDVVGRYPLPPGSRPTSIVAGRDGKMYVADGGRRRIFAITALEMTESQAEAARRYSPTGLRSNADSPQQVAQAERDQAEVSTTPVQPKKQPDAPRRMRGSRSELALGDGSSTSMASLDWVRDADSTFSMASPHRVPGMDDSPAQDRPDSTLSNDPSVSPVPSGETATARRKAKKAAAMAERERLLELQVQRYEANNTPLGGPPGDDEAAPVQGLTELHGRCSDGSAGSIHSADLSGDLSRQSLALADPLVRPGSQSVQSQSMSSGWSRSQLSPSPLQAFDLSATRSTSALDIRWTHILSGHAPGGTRPGHTSPLNRSAAGAVAASSSSAETDNRPRSIFLEAFSAREQLEPLIRETVASSPNPDCSAKGNLLAFGQFPYDVGKCFNKGTGNWDLTKTMLVVRSPDGSTVITTFPVPTR